MRFLKAILISAFLCAIVSCVSPGRLFYSRDIAAEYYALAEGYAGLKNYDKALVYYTEASRIREFRNASLWGIGRMHALKGNWNEAVQVFASLYEQDRSNMMLANAYAYALAASGNTREAVFLYRSLYESSVEDPEIARNYVEILSVAGEHQLVLDVSAVLRLRFPDSSIITALTQLEAKAAEALKKIEDSSKGNGVPDAGADSVPVEALSER